MRTIIIDDEEHFREDIAKILQRYCPTVTIVAKAVDVKSGLLAVKTHLPELILLDINLPDGTGFDILKQLNPIDFKVIFITAYEEYAVKAFKFSALDYILKPVSSLDLAAAIDKAYHIKHLNNMELKYNAFMANINETHHPKNMVVKTTNTYHIILINEIIRCEADGNYTKVIFNDKRTMLVSKTLKEFDELLHEQGFFRIHKSHLINLAYTDRYEKSKEMVVMKDKSAVPVSVFKKQIFLDILDKGFQLS
ncbi:MAG: LytTR family DNA-binding domain-containing protein [Bacteroidota bacterium]|nr:LytTR family DNA-binding domain-containing protein [Bacteroidota bacterium]